MAVPTERNLVRWAAEDVQFTPSLPHPSNETPEESSEESASEPSSPTTSEEESEVDPSVSPVECPPELPPLLPQRPQLVELQQLRV